MGNEKDEYRGTQALEFAERHLIKVKSNPDTWETEYIFEETGDTWIMDYPDSAQHGGGIPRLRKLE